MSVEFQIYFRVLKQGGGFLYVHPSSTEHGYRSETAKHACKDGYRRFLDNPFRQTEREKDRQISRGKVSDIHQSLRRKVESETKGEGEEDEGDVW